MNNASEPEARLTTEQFSSGWVFWHVPMQDFFKETCNYFGDSSYDLSGKGIDRERHALCKPRKTRKKPLLQ